MEPAGIGWLVRIPAEGLNGFRIAPLERLLQLFVQVCVTSAEARKDRNARHEGGRERSALTSYLEYSTRSAAFRVARREREQQSSADTQRVQPY